ncbi:MAG: LON peptidase substrate-binding domain-containing protein [Planctomycetes bacterium]|nr:LON peptidase substrate-binding domain-containing protein [Planctomycetota bacterium]
MLWAMRLPEIVPVFPLPTTVLFPGTLLPLHLFEPRYRAMMDYVLGNDGWLAAALLRTGAAEDADTDAGSPVHAVMGVGRVAHHQTRDDGSHDVVLVGLARVLLREWTQTEPFRLARVEAAVETGFPGEHEEAAEAKRFRAWFRSIIEGRVTAGDLPGFLKMLEDNSSFAVLVNTVAAGFVVDAARRQALLEVQRWPERVARVRLEVERQFLSAKERLWRRMCDLSTPEARN